MTKIAQSYTFTFRTPGGRVTRDFLGHSLSAAREAARAWMYQRKGWYFTEAGR